MLWKRIDFEILTSMSWIGWIHSCARRIHGGTNRHTCSIPICMILLLCGSVDCAGRSYSYYQWTLSYGISLRHHSCTLSSVPTVEKMEGKKCIKTKCITEWMIRLNGLCGFFYRIKCSIECKWFIRTKKWNARTNRIPTTRYQIALCIVFVSSHKLSRNYLESIEFSVQRSGQIKY